MNIPSPVAALGDRFDEAIEAFREKSPLLAEEFEQLDEAARAQAFTVAGAARVDVVASVWRALDLAIATGQPLEEFRAAITPLVQGAWTGPAPRVETILRTNTLGAYNAGRFRQATHPDVRELRPVWRFDAILDGRTSSVCRRCQGVTLPSDHPWWRTHLAPLHHQCRSSFLTLRASQAGALSEVPTDSEPVEGFGRPPGEPWRPDPADYPAPLRSAVERLAQGPPP